MKGACEMRTIELDFGDLNNYFVREAFNTLRTNILFSGKDVKTIIVTSCVAHEGKTTVSFEMAKSLAEADKKVLLIDADLRKSVTVSRYTKERGVNGLSQILSGQVTLEQSVYRTQIEGLDVIFAGPYPPNPAELVGSPVFKEMLDCVRDAYDYIIVDAPPLGLVIDAAVMASVCDGAVIVINQGNIKYRLAQNVKAQLAKSGCRILGVVLNQTQRKKRSVRGRQSEYYAGYGDYYSSDSAMAAKPRPAAQLGTNGAPVRTASSNSAARTAPRTGAPAGTTGTGAKPQSRPASNGGQAGKREPW
ncbi:MAG: CpsD/CapB family tyrosine-protein kinase [Ruminococcaceae bacterium]|nr:CpsD/CapB family tyrosine-protein kinase [Oscillospiraceae bacterium]